MLLRKTMGKDAPRVSPAIGMPVADDGMPWGFRQKAAFVFDAGPDGLVMGHFARGTNDVVPVEECPVHAERANRIAFALRDALAAAERHGVGTHDRGRRPPRDRPHQPGRDGSGRDAGGLSRDDSSLAAPLQAVLAGEDKPEGLVLNLNDRAGPYLVGRESKRVAGTGHVKETSLGPAFLVSPTSFFQTNVAAAATLVRLVLEALPGERGLKLLDLYSGSGLFALPVALRGHQVTAVEESRKSIKDAELNRRLNGVKEDRLKLVCSAVEKALPHYKPGAFDAVILDPPREGCPPDVVKAVFGRLRPARGIFVSCEPEALARELPLAVAAGYRVLRVQPVDMFPHTPARRGGRGARAAARRQARRVRQAWPVRQATYTVFTFTNSRIPRSVDPVRLKVRLDASERHDEYVYRDPHERSSSTRAFSSRWSAENGAGWQHLDRDVAAELCVGGAVHLAHAAGSERRDDLEGAETPADHGRGSRSSLAVQPSTTAIGSRSSTRLRLRRNRWPSGKTSYCRSTASSSRAAKRAAGGPKLGGSSDRTGTAIRRPLAST